jgi:hypothetical protein
MSSDVGEELTTSRKVVATTIVVGVVLLVELVLAVVLVLECIDVLADDPGFRQEFDFLRWHGQMNTDTIIIILAMAAGIVGSFIGASTSYVKYYGNRRLVLTWVPWYLARAPIGAALAIIFYLIIRAGFLPTTEASDDVSALGVAAMAGLAGMFSNRAADRLEIIFNAAFGEETESEDKLVPTAPTITAVSWLTTPQGEHRIVIEGERLGDDPVVMIGDRGLTPEAISPERLEVVVGDDIRAAVTSETRLRVSTTSGRTPEVDLPPFEPALGQPPEGPPEE